MTTESWATARRAAYISGALCEKTDIDRVCCLNFFFLALSYTWNAKHLIAGNLNDIDHQWFVSCSAFGILELICANISSYSFNRAMNAWTGGKRVLLSRYLRMEKKRGKLPFYI